MSAIILLANRFRFAANDDIRQGPVSSCQQLWCLSGRGQICCNGQDFELTAGRVLLLPWGRHMRYVPDASDPFHVAAIHLMPHARTAKHEQYFMRVPHFGEQRFPYGDTAAPVLPAVLVRAWDEQSAWALCSEAVVASFRQAKGPSDIDPVQQQQFAALILGFWATARDQHEEPDWLPAVRDCILACTFRRLELSELIHVSGMSASSLERALRDFADCTPMQFVFRVRMQQARVLLSDSKLSIQDIAAQLGFTDAFHFSRRFKSNHGISPRAWRQQYAMP